MQWVLLVWSSSSKDGEKHEDEHEGLGGEVRKAQASTTIHANES